eukprot:g695.t1
MAEDRLRQEAKNLIEQIKHLRVQEREARESSGRDWPLRAASDGASEAPPLLDNPKMRRVLKGHFGKVRDSRYFEARWLSGTSPRSGSSGGSGAMQVPVPQR